MRCAIWYQLYSLKNVKNAHGRVLLLVKLQAKSRLNVTTLLHGCFLRFLNCTNGTKLRKTSHIFSDNKNCNQNLLQYIGKIYKTNKTTT